MKLSEIDSADFGKVEVQLSFTDRLIKGETIDLDDLVKASKVGKQIALANSPKLIACTNCARQDIGYRGENLCMICILSDARVKIMHPNHYFDFVKKEI